MLLAAAVVSISDFNETLGLNVALPNQSTSPGDAAPGSGAPIDLTPPTPSNGISFPIPGGTAPLDRLPFNLADETLSFEFANQIPWGASVYQFRFLTAGSDVTPTNPTGLSDLFVIQGLVGTNPDDISLLSLDSWPTECSSSDPAIVGRCVTSLVPNLFGAAPADLGTQVESNWNLVADTGVDQYYVNSAPEPATIALLGVGLLGIGFARRKRV